MVNEPPPSGRRPHPLEQKPVPRQPPPGAQRDMRILHIPAVPPHVTYTLIAINVVVFVVRALSPVWDQRIVEWGVNSGLEVLGRGEYHRLLTSMFMHASIYRFNGQYDFTAVMHILLNMYVLYHFGRALEPIFGHRRFLLIYILGGLAGSVLSAVASPETASLGASGAVFAILAAELVYFYRHRKLFGQIARARIRSVLVWTAINFAYGAVNSVLAVNVRIDNWGHLGGFLGGLILTWFIGPDFLPRQHPELPNDLTVDDVNPLSRRTWVLSLYVAGLLAVLIVGAWMVRR
jgi:membrane associated rhomboid family serine protease